MRSCFEFLLLSGYQHFNVAWIRLKVAIELGLVLYVLVFHECKIQEEPFIKDPRGKAAESGDV